MEEEIYFWDNGAKRKAKKISCKKCGIEWLIRKDRKHSGFCRKCKIEGEKNPQFGKIPYNKGKGKYGKTGWTKGKRIERKKEWIKYKGNICEICGKYNLPISCLVFHHKDPEDKLFSIQSIFTDINYEKKRKEIKEEIDKCMLVCKNCHSIIHYGCERLIEGGNYSL